MRVDGRQKHEIIEFKYNARQNQKSLSFKGAAESNKAKYIFL